MTWSMVSKAADKSSNTNKLPFLFPIVEAISLITLKSAVSQLLHNFHNRDHNLLLWKIVSKFSPFANEFV